MWKLEFKLKKKEENGLVGVFCVLKYFFKKYFYLYYKKIMVYKKFKFF